MSPDPGLQRTVGQVCVSQRLRHVPDAGHPDGLGNVSNPAARLGLRPSHGGTPQAHRPLRRAQSHRILSPQSGGRAAGQEQPVREEEKVEDLRPGREERAKLRAEVRVNSVKKVSSEEHFFIKTSTLPAHIRKRKHFQVLTTLHKCRTWLDTFTSFLIDQHPRFK